MKLLLALVFTTFLPAALVAQDTGDTSPPALSQPVGESDLTEFLWKNRVIVVFADNAADPRFHEQMDRFADGGDMLAERDVVVLTDTDPAARSAARKQLRPRGFSLIIIDKDGGVKLRKPAPWSVSSPAQSTNSRRASRRCGNGAAATEPSDIPPRIEYPLPVPVQNRQHIAGRVKNQDGAFRMQGRQIRPDQRVIHAALGRDP